MKTIKKLLWIIVGMVIVLSILLAVGIHMLSPVYSGVKELDELTQKVEVYYDNYGIPHIYAKEEEDAFRSLGYVHAQDRLWQMELLRRIGEGRLSEVFGADLVKTDKFFLTLGIDEASQRAVDLQHTDSPMVQLSQAYLDGINQFIADGPTPIEFYLTGLEKRPFTLKDVYNTVGYMAFSLPWRIRRTLC